MSTLISTLAVAFLFLFLLVSIIEEYSCMKVNSLDSSLILVVLTVVGPFKQHTPHGAVGLRNPARGPQPRRAKRRAADEEDSLSLCLSNPPTSSGSSSWPSPEDRWVNPITLSFLLPSRQDHQWSQWPVWRRDWLDKEQDKTTTGLWGKKRLTNALDTRGKALATVFGHFWPLLAIFEKSRARRWPNWRFWPKRPIFGPFSGQFWVNLANFDNSQGLDTTFCKFEANLKNFWPLLAK